MNENNRLAEGLRIAGYWLLILLAVLAPLTDRQPVNAIAFLFAIVVFFLLLLQGRQWLQRWDAIDWSMLALLVSAIVSTIFGWPSSGRLQGIAEAVSHYTMFVFLRHGRHSETNLRSLAIAVITGTVLGALLALTTHASGMPFHLPGVRGNIRSALYTGITLLLCLGLALHNQGGWRYVGLSVALFLAVMVFAMASRAVTFGLVLCLLLGFFASYRRRAMRYVLFGFLVIGIIPLLLPRNTMNTFTAKATELAELITDAKISTNDQVRIEIWRASWAWVQRGEHMLLGIGPRNYFLINKGLPELVPLQFEETLQSSHAHNMFLTRYIEQGVFGLLALLAFLVLVARRLLLDAIHRRTGWAWWSALGGWWLPLISGLVGSSWNHDYAWLAVFTFALYLGSNSTSCACASCASSSSRPPRSAM